MNLYCVLFLVYFVLPPTEGCFFRNCQNRFTYTGKRSPPDDNSKQQFQEAIPNILQKDIEKCPQADVAAYACDFMGSTVCCAIDRVGVLRCNKAKTSADVDFVSEENMNSAEEILQNYVTGQMYDGVVGKKEYCVSIGVCCRWGRCSIQATCDWDNTAIDDESALEAGVLDEESSKPISQEIAKLLELLRRSE